MRVSESVFGLEESDGGLAKIDLRQFDLVITGSISDSSGRSDRAVKFNAYSVIKRRYAAAGQTVDEATLIHDALQFKGDYLLIQKALRNAK